MTGMSSPLGPPYPLSTLLLTEVCGRLGEVMAQHYGAGWRHLLTEDTLRFAAVVLLQEHGVPADQLGIETPVPGLGRGKLDLTVGADTVIEFKFPRDPKNDAGAADRARCTLPPCPASTTRPPSATPTPPESSWRPSPSTTNSRPHPNPRSELQLPSRVSGSQPGDRMRASQA